MKHENEDGGEKQPGFFENKSFHHHVWDIDKINI